MPNCTEIITDIYQHPALNNLIAKIKPHCLQDDLRQEIAISLLEQPCERIAIIHSEQGLLKYALRACWNMATTTNGAFFYKYKKNDFAKALEYLRSLQGQTIPTSYAHIAAGVLQDKNKTVYEDHEARIFNKYIELGSARKVAAYYNIPVNHTCNVISKVKKELKCLLRS